MIRLALALVAAGLLAAPPAHAGPLLSGPGTGAAFTNPVGVAVQTIGFDFTVGPAPLLVTRLGNYDFEADGLVTDHLVRLWTPAGVLLAQATVPAGTAAALDGTFRVVDLAAPVRLEPGQTYVLGAVNPTDGTSDGYVSNSPAQIAPFVAPEATFVQGRRNLGGSTFAGFAPNGTTRIGPNLTFVLAPAAVPEPATFAALGLLATGGIAAKRRRA